MFVEFCLLCLIQYVLRMRRNICLFLSLSHRFIHILLLPHGPKHRQYPSTDRARLDVALVVCRRTLLVVGSADTASQNRSFRKDVPGHCERLLLTAASTLSAERSRRTRRAYCKCSNTPLTRPGWIKPCKLTELGTTKIINRRHGRNDPS